MKQEDKLIAFNDKKIRRVWHNNDWYFSVVDVVLALTESIDAKDYWYRLKKRENALSEIELSTFCRQLKLEAPDGKMRKTDVADTKGVLRIIQSIPSKKAEPFKLWLAKVGSERLDEDIDPEISINRAMKNYFRLGRSKEWINQRLKSIEIRKELTDEWQERGVKEGVGFGILTNEMIKTWSGMKTDEYKNFKGLKKENLRDNMTNLELVLNMLAEVSTTEISKKIEPQTFEENKNIAVQGGKVAKTARKELEEKTKEKVVSSDNYLERKGEKKKLVIKNEK